MKAYQDDLAYIHHVGFTAFIRDAAPGVLGLLRTGGVQDGLVVDLGCGSGEWPAALTDAGYRVLGIDISSAMIRLARQQAPRARFRVGSLLNADLPRCNAVTALGECCNYRFDRSNSQKALLQLFRRVHGALHSGGLFLFDVAEPDRSTGAVRRFYDGPDWTLTSQVTHDRRRHRLTRRITTFRKIGRHYRRGQEVHELQLYRGSQLAEQLRRVGFRVRLVRGYGELRFGKGHVGLVARKR
jgi:SAM-dependent methyltransferase